MSATARLGHAAASYRVAVTLFADEFATDKTECVYTLAQLIEIILTADGERKEDLRWLKLARFGDERTEKNSLRHNRNVQAVSGVEADYDAERMAFREALERATSAGILCVIYTSPSHTEDMPRWRVICPFSKEYTPDKRAQFLARLNGVFGGIFSNESWTLSQSYYFGSVNHNPSHQAELIDGTPIDQLDHLDVRAIAKPTRTKPQAERPAPKAQSSDQLDRRGQRYVDKLLDNVRRSREGEKHFTLLHNARSLGGIMDAAGISEADALAWLMDALPDTVKDWNNASRTALDGLRDGRVNPIELEDRPRTKGNGVADYSHAASPPPPPPEPPPPEPGDDPGYQDSQDAQAAEQHAAARRTIAVRKAKFNINAEEGEAALLAADYPVFRRDRQLVRPVIGEVEASEGSTTTTVMLVALGRPVLRQMLNEVADWQRFDARSKAMVATAPPNEVAELILARVGYWPFRPISGVIATPTIRPDGSLLAVPGYDKAAGLWLNDLPSMPAIPDKPTRCDAEQALKVLNELLDGFPFVDRAARAVALSGMITPVVRAAMSVAPMHVASAPAPGTGKSYLWDVASHIAIGRPCAVIAAARDEAETEKRLIAAVLRGQPMVSIDNLNGPIEGDFVCQMIERPFLELRPLGSSDMFTVANRITSYATGNNIRGRGDVVRRLVHCRLDANMEHPERRQFTTKPHIQVQDARGRYVAACLTIVRAYIVADRPGRLPPLASFEGWSNSVRSALVWLGCADPARTMETGHDDDDLNEEAAALFAAWPDVFTEYTAAELIEAAQEGDSAGALLRPSLLEALKPIARDRRGNLDVATLAYWLRGHRDLVVGERKLVRKGTRTRPGWAVETV
jgi:putative DNA primase/helicase